MRFFTRTTLVTFTVLCAAGSLIAQDKQEDYAAQLAKVTPVALPQSPVVRRSGSDAKDDQFKGPAKTLVEEKEYLDKTEYPAERHNTRRREFGKDGNLVSEIFYDYRGNPHFAVAYGYLDGKRVSRPGGFIHHSYDPPPMMALPGMSKPETKGDDRYTSAWEYKYDKEGRIVEELRYNNSGQPNYRTTYEYGSGTQAVSSCNVPCNYTPNVATSTVDDKGFEIRTEYADKDDLKEPRMTLTFKYLEFDKQGNWTKREATGSLRNSRGTTKPVHYVEYRTFTYF